MEATEGQELIEPTYQYRSKMVANNMVFRTADFSACEAVCISGV